MEFAPRCLSIDIRHLVGTLPFLIRDLSQRVIEVPEELLVKAQTLGASSWVIAIRVALPQVMPRLIQSVRLSLGPAWLFLIAAEAIASDAGLGYRISAFGSCDPGAQHKRGQGCRDAVPAR